MEASYIIQRPVLTEKSTEGMNERGEYTFVVDPRASKSDVKRAVEELFGVKVRSVRTQLRKGAARRMKYGWVRGGETKKATVTLAEGQTIELF